LLLLRVGEGGNSHNAIAAMTGGLGRADGRIQRVPRPASNVIFGISPLVGGIVDHEGAHSSTKLLASV
jgi:hypothetical protein